MCFFAIYQEGMPFYHQVCRDEEPNKGCTKSEKDIYSRPIDIAFRVRWDVDLRSGLDIANQWTLIDWLSRGKKCKQDEYNCSKS